MRYMQRPATRFERRHVCLADPHAIRRFRQGSERRPAVDSACLLPCRHGDFQGRYGHGTPTPRTVSNVATCMAAWVGDLPWVDRVVRPPGTRLAAHFRFKLYATAQDWCKGQDQPSTLLFLLNRLRISTWRFHVSPNQQIH